MSNEYFWFALVVLVVAAWCSISLALRVWRLEERIKFLIEDHRELDKELCEFKYDAQNALRLLGLEKTPRKPSEWVKK